MKLFLKKYQFKIHSIYDLKKHTQKIALKRIPPKTIFLSKYLFIQKKFNHIVLSSYSSDNWSTMQDKRKLEICIVIFICFTIPFNEHFIALLDIPIWSVYTKDLHLQATNISTISIIPNLLKHVSTDLFNIWYNFPNIHLSHDHILHEYIIINDDLNVDLYTSI